MATLFFAITPSLNCVISSYSSPSSSHYQQGSSLLKIRKVGVFRKPISSTSFIELKRRRTLICAVNQDAEKAFKKTVEVDMLIDMLRDANPKELQKLVVENVLAFNEGFWIRLAARSDTCKSEDDKKDYEELATSVMSIVDCLVHKTREKIESSTDVLKEILKPVVNEVEEISWPPRDPEALKIMEKEIIQREEQGQLDEGFLAEVSAQLRQAKEDADKPGLEAMLQKVLQLYASRVLSKRSYAKKGDEILKAEQFLETVIKDSQFFWYQIRYKEMGSLGAILKHPDDFYPLLKLKMAARHAEKQIPLEPHWGFCYSMLHKVSRSFGLVIQQLGTELRNAVCIFYLVLRALDTVEDDTSIPTDVKVPILIEFYHHIYDPNWHFSCGTKEYKVLMDQFHQLSSAFLELGKSYQEAIEDITMKMGAGMAKFICKEVETIDDYDEYCHYVAGLVGLGLSKLFHASGLEDLAPGDLSNSMGLFLQKTNIIRDYLEDINEIPKSRMFWPRQIWSKYVNKLEELKYEENSVKSVECLNDMVTNALIHAEDCLKYMSDLRDPAIFRFCAIPQIMAIGTLALCYNNIEVFRGVVKMRRGLTAKVIDRTKTMSDVYGAFFDFSCMLKSKVDNKDPNAQKTLSRLESIQKTCRDSGVLNKRKSYILRSEPRYNPTLIVIFFIILAIIFAYYPSNRLNN